MDLDGLDLTTEAGRGPRVLLRPFRHDDVDTAYRACQDADLQRWLTALPSPYTRGAAVEFVTGIAPRGRAAGRPAPTSAAPSRSTARWSAPAGRTT